MIERAVHFLFFAHKYETLAASIAFYMLVILVCHASSIAGLVRRAARSISPRLI